MSDRRAEAIIRFDAARARYNEVADPIMDELLAVWRLTEVGKILPLELRDELQTNIDRCRSLIRAAKPYRACPYCYGVEAIKQTCRPCGGAGWVNKNTWHLCEASVKQELEGT